MLGLGMGSWRVGVSQDGERMDWGWKRRRRLGGKDRGWGDGFAGGVGGEWFDLFSGLAHFYFTCMYSISTFLQRIKI